MGFKSFLADMLGLETKKGIEVNSLAFSEVFSSHAIKEIAILTCIERIAKAIASVKFDTYRKGERHKDEIWYKLNFEPNQNQNKVIFLQKLVAKLYRENEVLVVQRGGEFLIADSFEIERKAMSSNIYRNVIVEGLQLNGIFFENEVLYFKSSQNKVKNLLDSFYKEHGAILETARKSYKKAKGEKGILMIDSLARNHPEFTKTYENMVNQNFKNYFENENAVLPLFEGFKYEPAQQKTYSSEGTRDIKHLYDDVFEICAKAFCLPPSLVKGDVQDTASAVDELLMFCINPLVEMLEAELNRKLYGKNNIVNKTYLNIDTSKVKFLDVFGKAGNVDKLISCGLFSINDIKEKIGEPRIEEDWADKHFITKNYGEVEEGEEQEK